MITLLSNILFGIAHQEETIFGYDVKNNLCIAWIDWKRMNVGHLFLVVQYFEFYANDVAFISEGSFFHGMKVLAMPLKRYGTAWCWFIGAIQILSITIQQQHIGQTIGIAFLLTEEATIHALTPIKILCFLRGNDLM